jgi:hypothetical protein
MAESGGRDIGTKSSRNGLGVSPGSGPRPRDHQQARLLEILRRHPGEAVTYVDLQSAGIEFPASVVAELELAGVQIDRCQSGGPGGRPLRAVRLPGTEEVVGRSQRGVKANTPPPQAAASQDWDEVRVYRGSIGLALGTAWAELRRGRGRALLGANTRPIEQRHRPSVRLMVSLALLVAIMAITAGLVTGISGGKAHRQLLAHGHPRSATSARVVPTRSTAQRRTTTASEPAHASSSHISAAAASPRVSTSSASASSPARPSPGPSTGLRSRPGESRVGTPSGAVQAFYEAAAHHQYGAAWALADANMRSQLEGYTAFANQMSSVRSITFHRAQMLHGSEAGAATVAVKTSSIQSTRMRECGGMVRTVRTTAGWRLDGISINCS